MTEKIRSLYLDVRFWTPAERAYLRHALKQARETVTSEEESDQTGFICIEPDEKRMMDLMESMNP